ncbi:MAG: DotA/TraY family protein [Alphaproteobacteria bacterium]
MATITRKQFLTYTILPGFRHRIQDLFFAGFNYIPFFIALVYQTVKLLPPGHAYLNPANIGRFGIRHVIAEAANNLVVSRKNLDQIALFLLVLLGLVIVIIQILMLAVTLLFQPAFAGIAMPTNFAGFFITATPDQDLAMMLLDLIFGVPNMFFSCVSTGGNCQDINGDAIVNSTNTWILQNLGYPFPIHIALHAMFRIYSLGLLVVATLISLYFITTVALETAQTGTAFGKRFNRLWAPIRIVVAFGLLMPIGTPGAGAGAGGMNSAQYIVLYAAKFGSGFASNGWNIFNSAMTDTYLGTETNLVSTPNPPEMAGILQFTYTAATCGWLEWIKNGQWITPYVVRDALANPPNMLFANAAGAGGGGSTKATYDDIITFIEGDANIVVRFGVIDETNLYKGHVKPVCGEIIIPLSDPRPVGTAEPGTELLQRYYVFIVQEMWADIFTNNYGTFAGGFSDVYPLYHANKYVRCPAAPSQHCGAIPGPPPANFRSQLYDFYKQDIQNAIDASVQAQINSGTWAVGAALQNKGWAAAAIWYNKVAELNGAITEASANVPIVTLWPVVMEYVREEKRQHDGGVSMSERFKPELGGKNDVQMQKTYDADFAMAMWDAFNYWQEGGFATTSHTQPTGNVVIDGVNAVFGTSGLYSMRRNPDVHPLAQLVGVGRSLVFNAINMLGYATAGAGAAAIASSFENFIGSSLGAASGFLVSVVMITLSAGFILYYVVPFLPFIYFYFAVGGWLKAIFEAMVGLPLWALAHIRIDGNGLPGSAAVNGYFLIFEIFVRPILIVFGLLASISIFSAMVYALNQVWDLVTSNLSGFDVESETKGVGASIGEYFRSALDEFMFTVIYAIVVYMMGMSSFKLIDQIPTNILRWMGQSVATFNDSKEAAAENMVSTASVGANQAIQGIGGSLNQATQLAAKTKTP